MRGRGKLVLAGSATLAVAGALAAGAIAETKGVDVKDDRFSPDTRTIDVDDSVKWTWKGENPHNVTWTSVPSGESKKGKSTRTEGTYTRTFDKAGKYRYSCTIHSGMNGKVVVEK
jgi:plastocyanin